MKSYVRFGLAAALWLVAPLPASAITTHYVNATVYGDDAASRNGFWVQDGLIVASPGGAADETVDLEGGYVVFRLTDAHGHLTMLGRATETVDLVGARSPSELVARAAAAPVGEGWLDGFGWDQNAWPDKAFPGHGPLSAALPDRPTVLTRIDGHALLANAAAMRAAGVDPTAPAPADPPGGRVLHDAAGRPSGVFVDAAMALVSRAQPPPSREAHRRWILAAYDRLLAVGLTAVHDMGADAETIALLRELEREGRIPIRTSCYTDGLLDVEQEGPASLVRVVGVKLFADGALGSRGAALLAPYSDAPSSSGHLIQGPDALRAAVVAARDRHLAVAIHAIGDRAVRVALDALHGAAATGPFDRIEHVQVVAPEDFARFSREHIVASMQPTHATSDMAWAESRLGPERLRGAYARRRMLDSGATLLFGTDFPIERPDPRLTLLAAVARQDGSGRPPGGWNPEEAVSLDEALLAMTRAPARVVGDTQPHADFTVFSRAFSASEPSDWPGVEIRRVVVGGRTVFPTPR